MTAVASPIAPLVSLSDDSEIPPNVGVQAEVIADSISPRGHRVTTITATMHRFVLPAFNTHRVFNRNSGSDRAIPVRNRLDMVDRFPAFPVSWPAEQPGMQGGAELTGDDLLAAQRLFAELQEHVVIEIERYLDMVALRHPGLTKTELAAHTLHKSVLNRLLETWLWQTVTFTATDWQGFFDQRCSHLAQAEIAVLAEVVREALHGSSPTPLEDGDWHLPFIRSEDRSWAGEFVLDAPCSGMDDFQMAVIEVLKRVSTARCARTSYLTHQGVRDPIEDLRLFGDLTSAKPLHASPLEHPCTPAAPGEVHFGSLTGWHQFRHEIEAEQLVAYMNEMVR